MLKQKQLHKHNPPHSFGDCYRTALACLLNRAPESIPNFGEHYGDQAGWDIAVAAWFKQTQLQEVSFYYNAPADQGPQEIMEITAAANPNCYYLLSGQSKNDTRHVVICLNDKIIWDPALDDSGIVGPMDGKQYMVSFLATFFHNADVAPVFER